MKKSFERQKAWMIVIVVGIVTVLTITTVMITLFVDVRTYLMCQSIFTVDTLQSNFP